MARFFITSTMVNNGKTFQFLFETEEAETVKELVDLLNLGGFVHGRRGKRDARDDHEPQDMAICATVVNMIHSAR